MATQVLNDALGTSPSLVRGFAEKKGLKERADYSRTKLPEAFEGAAKAEEEAARRKFEIDQGQIKKEAEAEGALAAQSRQAATEMEAGVREYEQFEAPEIKASDYAKNAALRLVSALIMGGIGGASGKQQLMAIREMQDAEDRGQKERFASAKLKFDEADRARKDHNQRLKDRFERMLNLLSKDRNAAMVEAKLIEAETGNGLIAAKIRAGKTKEAYDMFIKSIESSDKVDAELEKQRTIFEEKKALKMTPSGAKMGGGGSGKNNKIKISDIPSDMRADLRKAGDAVTNLNNVTSTLLNEHLMIAPSATVADAILLGIERGGDVAKLVKNLTGKDIKPETVNWWKGYREYISKVRNQLYGATLTANEQADFERFIVTPATDRKTALAYFENQKRTLRNAVERKIRETQAALEAETAEDLVRGVAGVTTQSSETPATPSNLPRINTKAEFDALAPGTEFIDVQDGKRYKKPAAR